MDPITLAIIGALGKLSESVIKDSYEALKAAIARKCGVDSDITQAVDHLEKRPESTGRLETLKEEIQNAKLIENPEILKLATELVSKLKELPDGERIINQTVTGNKNIFSATGNVTVRDSSDN
jgi:hypothetical protein